MEKEKIIALIGGNETVRDYLRGIEPGSEADRDAMRAMRAAIARMRAGGVRDVMTDYDAKFHEQSVKINRLVWVKTVKT